MEPVRNVVDVSHFQPVQSPKLTNGRSNVHESARLKNLFAGRDIGELPAVADPVEKSLVVGSQTLSIDLLGSNVREEIQSGSHRSDPDLAVLHSPW